MADLIDEPRSAENFNTGIRNLRDQINVRLRHLRRGLEQEIDRCRENNNAPDLARAYARFRNVWSEETDSIQEEMKQVGKVFTKLAETDFPEILERSGLHNVALDDADIERTIGVQVRTKASVASGKKEEAIEYLRAVANAIRYLEDGKNRHAIEALRIAERYPEASMVVEGKGAEVLEKLRNDPDANLEGIVVDHIFPQTLSSIAKDWAEEGRELPEDIFTTYLQTTTTWRKIASK